MVTEAGKELLRNTINTAKFHNRILEENEMWKQFELERGLTMMVSDDLILNRAKKHHHQCSKHRRRSKSKSRERVMKRDISAAGSSKEVDRWDHSGYRELYPDETDSRTYTSSSSRDNVEKWDHSGFLELYPDEANNMKNIVSKTEENVKKPKKKKRKKVSSSDTEIWEEFKTYKRKKAAKKSKRKSELRTVKHDTCVKKWRKQIRNDTTSSSSDS